MQSELLTFHRKLFLQALDLKERRNVRLEKGYGYGYVFVGV